MSPGPEIEARLVALMAILCVAAICDCRDRTIPNSIVQVGCVVGFLISLFGPLVTLNRAESFGLDAWFVGCSICFAVMLPLWAWGGTGGGDVKLAAVVGSFLGWRLGLSAILWGHLVAAMAAVIWLSWQWCRIEWIRRAKKPRTANEPSRMGSTGVRNGRLPPYPVSLPMAPAFLMGTAITCMGGSIL